MTYSSTLSKNDKILSKKRFFGFRDERYDHTFQQVKATRERLKPFYNSVILPSIVQPNPGRRADAEDSSQDELTWEVVKNLNKDLDKKWVNDGFAIDHMVDMTLREDTIKNILEKN